MHARRQCSCSSRIVVCMEGPVQGSLHASKEVLFPKLSWVQMHICRARWVAIATVPDRFVRVTESGCVEHANACVDIPGQSDSSQPVQVNAAW